MSSMSIKSMLKDLEYRGMNDAYTITGKLKEGRQFTYKLGDLLRQITPRHKPYHLEAMADEAMKEKYRFCAWDQEHLSVNSEAEIRKVVLWQLTDYFDWLRSKVNETQDRDCGAVPPSS